MTITLITRPFCIALLLAVAGGAIADPESDRQALRTFFQTRFPHIQLEALKDGAYALDSDARLSWRGFEEMPPYTESIIRGELLFNTPLAHNSGYSSCFGNNPAMINSRYPRFDPTSGKLQTLVEAINQCRTDLNAEPLRWDGDDLIALSAYLAFASRGKALQLQITDDARALEWYQLGKRLFYTRRGQLNLACADCHIDNAGRRLRDDILTPALGLLTHYPVYLLHTRRMTTIHQRFSLCFEQMRAAPLELQSDEYKALEYFLGYIANGLDYNGPGTRK